MRTLLVLAPCILWLYTHAQIKGNFKSFTVDDGLSQNTVWDVLQDHRGFLWIGTADGVDRYDGYRFHHYNHDNKNASSLGGVTLFDFLEDSQNQLWIAHSKGLDVYIRELDRFKRVYQSDFSCSLVNQDSSSIWLLDGNFKILKIDKHTRSVVDTIQFNTIASPIEMVRHGVRLGNKIVTGDQRDLFIVDVVHKDFYSVPVPSKFQWASFWKKNENEFVCISNGNAIHFNITTNKFITKSLQQNSDDPKITVHNFAMWNGALYGATEFGIYKFDPSTFGILEQTTDLNQNEPGTSAYVQNLYTDSQNSLYVCTNGSGLKIYSPFSNRFKHITTNNPKINFTRSILAKGDKIWVGVYGHDLVEFNKTGEFTHIKLPPSFPSISVTGVFELRKNHLALFHETEILIYNPLQKSFSKPIRHGDISYPHLKKISDNRFFYNTDSKLFVVDSMFQELQEIDLPSYGDVTSLLIHSMDQFWIGTNQGLYHFNASLKRATPSAIKTHIKSILKTSKNLFFVATISGLYQVDSSMRVLNIWGSHNSLPSDFIYGLLEDKHGYVWLSHNKGITRLDTENLSTLNFTAKDGLQSNEFNTGSFYKDDNGLLYFGGINGVNVINPDSIIRNDFPPQISINEINVGDIPYKTDSSYNEMHGLILSYQENTLSFDFSALEFNNIDGCKYAYYLEPYEPNWIEAGKKHFARYANLPPGEYRLKIKAANSDGVWMNQPRVFYITIVPPVWKRTWFIVLAILISIAGLALVVFLFVRRQQAKLREELEVQHKIELERIRISRDLHDHVGAHLSYLITNMDWMAEHPEEWETKGQEKLKSLSDAGRQAILTLRQTIWALSQQALTVEEFADRFKQYAIKMKEFNHAVDVVFDEKIMHNKMLSSTLALHLFRICQEALNNALKHSNASQIRIAFAADQHLTFRFEMTDNGVGFDYDAAIQNGQYGLRNMQARAAECSAHLQFQTSPGKGTQVIIEIK